ncbi:hypothetical protein Sm713_57690 [Streptomyces sp. TS71-3]|nr:hypothetical protein Sm713_57690 [Streptomyces sp. TS71-3]
MPGNPRERERAPERDRAATLSAPPHDPSHHPHERPPLTTSSTHIPNTRLSEFPCALRGADDPGRVATRTGPGALRRPMTYDL